VVDTGVDYNHPDLRGGRVRTDIDRDFANNDEDAMDDHGHGTFTHSSAAVCLLQPLETTATNNASVIQLLRRVSCR
jgi:subtilisin family serine protease